MSDNLKIKEPQDKNFINIHEEWEVNYWTKTLGVTKQQLVDAVKKVGTGTAAVKKYLGK